MDISLGSPNEVEETSQIACRRDGWTPFARKLFPSALAESGRVTAENSESLAEAEVQRQLWLADLREEIEELLHKGSDEQLTEALGDPLLGNAAPA
ncbi:MAG: hypothetical protein ABI770_01435 [Sphingomicrobium sp.]